MIIEYAIYKDNQTFYKWLRHLHAVSCDQAQQGCEDAFKYCFTPVIDVLWKQRNKELEKLYILSQMLEEKKEFFSTIIRNKILLDLNFLRDDKLSKYALIK